MLDTYPSSFVSILCLQRYTEYSVWTEYIPKSLHIRLNIDNPRICHSMLPLPFT